MKQTTLILFIMISLTSFRNDDIYSDIKCCQQQDIFAGNWKYKNGNEVFIIKLWKTADWYLGHYKK